MEKKLEVLSVLVDNNYGVVTRISSLFGRRGFNIDTFTGSVTDNPKISRITITLRVDPYELEQVVAQTMKLEEVLELKVLDNESSVMREIALIKVEANLETRSKVKNIADIYGASVVDLSPNSMIVELTGKPAKLDAFINIMEEFKIMEMCRTGISALERNKVITEK